MNSEAIHQNAWSQNYSYEERLSGFSVTKREKEILHLHIHCMQNMKK